MNCLVFEVSRKWFVSGGHSSKHDAPVPVFLAQRRWRQGNPELEVVLAYFSGLRPAWATQDPV